jgi:hypothetical protein
MEQFEVKRYKIQYPLSAYTFPQEARIYQVHFDEEYLHVDLTDGRKLSVPLWWIPTLHNAPRKSGKSMRSTATASCSSGIRPNALLMTNSELPII